MGNSLSILDHLNPIHRALGRVFVTGGDAKPFFAAEMRAFSFEGAKTNNVVEDVFGLRSLLVDANAQSLQQPAVDDFHPPRLLRLHARPRTHDPAARKLHLYDGSKARSALLSQRSQASDLLVAPAEAWPNQPNPEITVPAFRLVEGAYAAEVELVRSDGTPNDLGKFLSLDNDKLLGGLTVKLVARKVAVAITPDGIELEGSLSDPTVSGGVIAAIFRLECDIGTEGPAYRLRLARPLEAGGTDINELEARIASTFASLGPVGAPVSIRYDKRPLVPPLAWPLTLNTTGSRSLTFVKAGIGFDMAIDHAAIDVRVRTATRFPETEQGLAVVFVDHVTWRRKSSKAFEVDLRAGNASGSADIELKFASAQPANPWPGYVSTFPKKTAAAAPLRPTADRLLPLYQASRAMDATTNHAPYVFIPVQDGWVQIGLPEPTVVAAEQPKQVPTATTNTAMNGRIYGGQDQSERGLVIDDAARLDLLIGWSENQAQSVAIKAWGAKGQLAGFLYVAETSPNGHEALPTLQGGPAATRDLPLWFGAKPPMPYLEATVEWTPPSVSGPLAGNEVKATVSHETVPPAPSLRPTIAWLPFAPNPFITNHPLTRGQPASSIPSVSRDLLPRELASSFVLTWANPTAYLPALSGGGQQWWNWGQDNSTGFRDDSLVLTTLAGTEFLPNTSPGAPSLSASLRFDLSILDELYAWSDPPRKTAKSGSALVADDQDPVQEVRFPTALEPDRLKDVWRANRRRMALTRTQSAHLSDWIDVGTTSKNVSIAGLVETYTWPTTLSIEAGTATVFGAYKLAGVEYQLNGAAEGLGGTKAVSFAVDATDKFLVAGGSVIDVAGYAANVYLRDGLLWDSRGYGMAPLAANGSRKATVRAWDNTGVIRPKNLSLFTMKKAVNMGKPAHDSGWCFAADLGFFARDLPLVNGAFEGDNNPVESAVGTLGQAFDQANFAESLHEWRLFEHRSLGDAKRRHDLRWGPFAFKPLRLRQATFDGRDVKFLRIVGSMRINPPERTDGSSSEPFGPDEIYRRDDLVQIELTRETVGWSIKWIGVEITRSDNKVTFLEKSGLKLDFDVTFVGSKERDSFLSSAYVPATVSLDIQTAMTAAFSLCIFGSQRVLDLPITQRDDGGFTVVAKSALVSTDTKSSHAVLAPEVTFSVTRAECVLKITGAVHLIARLDAPRRNAKRHVLASFRPPSLDWLDLSCLTKQSIEIDHATGRVHCTKEGIATASPIFALKPVDKLKVHAALAGVLKPSTSATLQEIEFETVWARIVGGDTSQTDNLIDHTLTADGQTRNHQIELSWAEPFESPIRWPVGQVFAENGAPLDSKLLDPQHADHTRRSAVISIAGVPEKRLVHRVDIRLNRHGFVADTLRRTDTGISVAAPIRLLAVVDHQLIGGDGKRRASWNTLDHIAITTPELMAQECEAKTFSARYADGLYRTVAGAEVQAGIIQMNLGLAGFHDAFFADRFWNKTKSPLKSDQPLLLGGSAVMFPVGDDQARRDFTTVIPWMRAAIGPLNVKPGLWRVSVTDLWAATGLSPQCSKSQLIVGRETASSAVVARFLSGQAVVDTDAAKEMERVIPVEQAFFEKWKSGAPAKMENGDQFAAPFFLRAMMALDARLAAGAGNLIGWAAESLHARRVPTSTGAPDIAVARISIAEAKPSRLVAPDDSQPEFTASLTSISRISLLAEPAFRRVAAQNKFEPGPNPYVAMEVPRHEAIDLAVDLDRKALAAIVVIDGGGLPRMTIHAIEAAFANQTLHGYQLTSVANDLGASASLGWPTDAATAQLHQLAPELGTELPLLGHASGFAGRFQTFGWPAFAPERPTPIKEGEPPQLTATAPFEAAYLSFANHIAYERGTAARFPDGTERKGTPPLSFDGPTARHLHPAIVRRRAPTWAATKSMLETVERTLLAAPIVPPVIERGTLGRRPGVLEASVASVTVPADSSQFDSEHARFGRPANSGPIAAHQLRNPRSPILPLDQVGDDFARMEQLTLGYRRRTYVSLADLDLRTGNLPLFDEYRGSADIVRLEMTGRHDKLVFQPRDVTIGPKWSRWLNISIEVASTDLKAAKEQQISLRGRLEIGVSSFAFSLRLNKRTAPVAVLPIHIEKSTIEAKVEASAALDTALRSATADTPLRAVFEVVAPGIAPNPLVVLPLMLDPGMRRVVPIYRSTVIFGDPSYDRQLASQTASMPRFIDKIGATIYNLPFLLSVDRQEYDLGQTLYLAAGFIDVASGAYTTLSNSPAATLQFRRLPPQLSNGDIPQPELLKVAGADTRGLPLAEVFQIPLSRLVNEDWLGAMPVKTPLLPGDSLEVAVELAGMNGSVAVTVRVVTDPVIAPPPAVYSVIDTNAGRTAACVRLHASAPLPQKIEFPSLLRDLALEHVRRRALFNWSYALPGKGPPTGSKTHMLKFDRAGGAQLPDLI